MKVRVPSPDAVAAARRVVAECDVRHPRDIRVEAIATRYDAFVLYGPVATARASIVRAASRAVIRIDARREGTAGARFTAAHELGHHLLHPVIDHFEQCLGDVARSGTAWRVEREANDFAAELLIPEPLGAPFAASPSPRFEDVERLARTFTTSLEMGAIRFVQLSRAPCAAVLAIDGRVAWAPESAAFPGRIVKKRPLDPRSAAASLGPRAMNRVREVPGEAWGAPEPVREHAVRLGPRTTLSWIAARA